MPFIHACCNALQLSQALQHHKSLLILLFILRLSRRIVCLALPSSSSSSKSVRPSVRPVALANPSLFLDISLSLRATELRPSQCRSNSLWVSTFVLWAFSWSNNYIHANPSADGTKSVNLIHFLLDWRSWRRAGKNEALFIFVGKCISEKIKPVKWLLLEGTFFVFPDDKSTWASKLCSTTQIIMSYFSALVIDAEYKVTHIIFLLFSHFWRTGFAASTHRLKKEKQFISWSSTSSLLCVSALNWAIKILLHFQLKKLTCSA